MTANKYQHHNRICYFAILIKFGINTKLIRNLIKISTNLYEFKYTYYSKL